MVTLVVTVGADIEGVEAGELVAVALWFNMVFGYVPVIPANKTSLGLLPFA